MLYTRNCRPFALRAKMFVPETRSTPCENRHMAFSAVATGQRAWVESMAREKRRRDESRSIRTCFRPVGYHSALRQPAALHQDLGDLHGVGRRPLAEVVGHHPQV